MLRRLAAALADGRSRPAGSGGRPGRRRAERATGDRPGGDRRRVAPRDAGAGPAGAAGVETIRLVLATEALALPVGVPLAFAPVPDRRLGPSRAAGGPGGLAAFVPLPLHATAWLGAFGNAGRMQALGVRPVLVGRSGAAFVHAMAALPWVVLLAGVGLRTVEPELEESALLDLPAWRVLVRSPSGGASGRSPRPRWRSPCSRRAT